MEIPPTSTLSNHNVDVTSTDQKADVPFWTSVAYLIGGAIMVIQTVVAIGGFGITLDFFMIFVGAIIGAFSMGIIIGALPYYLYFKKHTENAFHKVFSLTFVVAATISLLGSF